MEGNAKNTVVVQITVPMPWIFDFFTPDIVKFFNDTKKGDWKFKVNFMITIRGQVKKSAQKFRIDFASDGEGKCPREEIANFDFDSKCMLLSISKNCIFRNCKILIEIWGNIWQ